jgi:hypothetical protein
MAEVNTSFKHGHYVPILKFKNAEMSALRLVPPEDKRHMTPLLELSPNLIALKQRKGLINRDLLKEVTKEVATSWGFAPIFIDIELLEAVLPWRKGKHPISLMAEAGRQFGLRIIPVTSLSRSPEYQDSIEEIVAADRRGVCLRLNENNLRNPNLEKELKKLLLRLKLTPKRVDLIVDFQVTDNISMKLTEVCNRLPFLPSWRTFTVASGAFPKDLTKLEKNQQHELKRGDWLYWSRQLKDGPVLARRPSYGDYTVQHPIYYEPPEQPNISASIRYTSHSYWVIMRGEGLLNEGGPGHAQYWAEARLLSKRKEFCGQDFSKGDEYIYKIGQQTKKTGNPRTWILAGINHHLIFVARQIANLSGSSTDGAPGDGSKLRLLPPPISSKSRREAYSASPQPRQFRLID